MLKLQSQNCKIEHVNFRTEKHGDDDVTAVDLKLSANLPPSVLDQLVPGMREHFFQAANSSGAMKGELALRFPDLVNTYAVNSDIPGYAIAVEWGMNGALVEFADAEVGKIKAELIDGGAVSLSFRVQVAGKPEELARLVPLLNLTLPVTLTPPAGEPLPIDHPDAKAAPKAAVDADPFAGSDLSTASDAAANKARAAKTRNKAAATAH